MAGPSRPWRSWPPALRASVAFGVVGGILLLVGFVTGSTPVLVTATAAGSLSLVSALVWRSQLIDAWRREHRLRSRGW